MSNFSKLRLSTALICALALTACSKKEPAEIPKTDIETAAASPVHSLLNCDDASVKNGLIQALSAQMGQDIDAKVADFNTNPDALMRKTLERVNALGLDLQNAHQVGELCQAELIVTAPSADLLAANRYYKANGRDLASVQFGNQITFDGNQLHAVLDYLPTATGVDLPNGFFTKIIADVMSAAAYNQANTRSILDGGKRVDVVPLQFDVVQIQPLPTTRTHDATTESAGDVSNNTATANNPDGNVTTINKTAVNKEKVSTATLTDNSRTVVVNPQDAQEDALKSGFKSLDGAPAKTNSAHTKTETPKPAKPAAGNDSNSNNKNNSGKSAQIEIVESSETY